MVHQTVLHSLANATLAVDTVAVAITLVVVTHSDSVVVSVSYTPLTLPTAYTLFIPRVG